MPSPLAHGAVAFALWPLMRTAPRQLSTRQRSLVGAMLVLGVLGPDADILVGWLLTGEAFAMHGGAWHSLFAGAMFGILFAVVCARFTSLPWAGVWLVGAMAWWSHVLLDACTPGRGVAMLWPLTSDRFSLPVPLFYGVRHSEPLAWHHHLVTVATETPFVLLMWLLGAWLSGRTLARSSRARGIAAGGVHNA